MNQPKNEGTVEIKIPKKFLWTINCPQFFNKGPEIDVGDESTRIYWAIFTQNQYDQFLSDCNLEEHKCLDGFSLWRKEERIGMVHKSN